MTYYDLYNYFLKKYNYKDDPNVNKDFFNLLFYFSKNIKTLADFYTFKNQEINFKDDIDKFFDFLYLMSKKHYPISYITKQHYFYGLKFNINKGSLIPRSETELLVDKIILENYKKNLKVVDLCAGIGNIGLTIANNLNAKVTVVEKYTRPFSLLKSNARKLGLIKKVRLKKMDIKKFFITCKKKFDILVMNPPYIAKNDKHIENNVKKYEPNSALYAKDNGLYYYKVVFEYLTYLLKRKLTCYFEINPEHKDILIKLINHLWYKNLCKITYEFSNDYHGLTRYLKLTLEDEDYKRQWFLL